MFFCRLLFFQPAAVSRKKIVGGKIGKIHVFFPFFFLQNRALLVVSLCASPPSTCHLLGSRVVAVRILARQNRAIRPHVLMYQVRYCAVCCTDDNDKRYTICYKTMRKNLNVQARDERQKTTNRFFFSRSDRFTNLKFGVFEDAAQLPTSDLPSTASIQSSPFIAARSSSPLQHGCRAVSAGRHPGVGQEAR